MRPRPYSRRTAPWLRNALGLATLSGSLAMVYSAATAAPVFTEFMRALGTTEFQFGLLSGIPLAMFLMQFAGAFINNRIRSRKPVFMITIIGARLLYIPAIFLPLLLPDSSQSWGIYLVIALISLSAAGAHAGTPLFFSWLADLVPHRILNRYWGGRQKWMYVTWSAAYASIILFTYISDLPITVTFPMIIVIGVFAGVIDILLFMGIPEPENTVVPEVSLNVMLEPFKDAGYRPFLVSSGVRWITTMFGAAFMPLFMLQELHIEVWQTTVIFGSMGLGVAASSGFAGRIADLHGHRPLLVIAAVIKPLTPLAMLIPAPGTGFLFLTAYMFIDGMTNGILLVAANGYMMKISPKRNRSMFCAAISGFSGICGGLGAILGGAFLEWTAPLSFHLFDRAWTNFHFLFIASILLRLTVIPLSRQIREPKSTRTFHVLNEVRGIGPLQFLRFPIGLYRRRRTAQENHKQNSETGDPERPG